MTEKTARQIENMKAQTFGVEVEGNNITRQNAARVAAEYFGTGRYEYTASRNGYMTWSAWDAQGREWKFQRDVSISGPDDEKCELVTPILTYTDMETFQELLRKLRHAGMKSSPSRGCGVHIHIGLKGLDGRDHNAKTLRNLVNIMAAHETQIGRAIKIDQGRTGHYCKVVNPDFLARVNRQKPQTMQRLADCWYEGNHASYGRNQHYNDSRYHMLNLHASFTKGTIEFRLFQFSDPHDGKHGGIHAGGLHPALPGHERTGQGDRLRQPQAPADRKREIRLPLLDAPPRLHRRRVRDGQGDPPEEHGRQRSLETGRLLNRKTRSLSPGSPGLRQ